MAQFQTVSGVGSTNESDFFVEREFVDGRKPRSATIRGHLYRVACADHCVMVLTAFSTRTFPPRELAIKALPGPEDRMRDGACVSILFSLPQHVHELVRDINFRDLVEETRFALVLSSLALRRSKKF